MRNKHWVVLFNGLMTFASLTMMSSSAHATIFKCINTQGAIYYNDKPCPKSNEETKIKAIKDPKGGYKSSYINEDKNNKVPSSKNIRKKEKEKNTTKSMQIKKTKDIKKPSKAGGRETSSNTVTNYESSSLEEKKGSASSGASGVSGSPSAIDPTKERDLSVVIPSHLFH